ncbi:MAG: HPr family phosphocarrier protein [Planctomycetota bacterium]
MSQAKATRTVTVANPDGLHVRAASLVAKLTGRGAAKVELIKGNRRVDATNVLQILSLCALEGDQLLLEATGQDADAALEALVELFENQFDEDKSSRQHKHPAGEPSRADATPDGNPSRG